MHTMHFKDRTEAGQLLAEKLIKFRGMDGVVYALPRGGVPLAAEVAFALGMPLDLLIPRKIGHPLNPEYAICAVGEGGKTVCNELETSRVDPEWLKTTVNREQAEAHRRRLQYLADQAPLPVTGKVAIIVDDGIATGLTMQAAIRDIKQRKPSQIIVAIPVSPANTAARLSQEVDKVVALDIPEFYLGAVGAYYDDFSQTTDEEVKAILKKVELGYERN